SAPAQAPRLALGCRPCRGPEAGGAERGWGGLLPVVLNAVRRDVVQQRGAMLPRRSRANQLRMLPQELLQERLVAADDRLGRRLERGGLRASMSEGIEVSGEGGPARKTVRPCEDELRV